MNNFKELMNSKIKNKEMLSDEEKEMAGETLDGLNEDDDILSKLQNANKVTVMADDEEGLQEGLETAEELIEKTPDMTEMDSEPTLSDLMAEIKSLKNEIAILKGEESEMPLEMEEETYTEEY